ncbi:MAG: ABC transporter permease [Nitrospirae bacterium]|nr:MAG: ABC transporter permease [Nitrospirota bacterium]
MVYSVKLALKSLWREKWINLLSVLTISVGIFVLSTVSLLLLNLELASRRLPEKFTITIFLEDNASSRDVMRVRRLIERSDMVEKVDFISKEEALEDLKKALKDSAYILEGLDKNPLFPTFVLKLHKEGFDSEKVEKLIKEIRGMRGVEDIVYGEEFLGVMSRMRLMLKLLVGALITLFFIATVFVCYSTVKILFYRRKEEIEIFKLLGATGGFVRFPFLVEGGLIGLLGGACSTGLLFGLIEIARHFAFEGINFLPGVHLTVPFIVIQPVFGMILGLLGSAIAVGRVKF